MPMVTSPRRERLEARVATEQKELLQDAAALEGQTLSEFLVSSALNRARAVIQEHQVVTLGRRDSEAFVNALLNPPPPNEAMQRAARRYKAALRAR